jgi:L-ascorbate metabolism protein UlaG (beta-lactamase superfamily)
MFIRRLGFAGLQLTSGDTSVLIDVLTDMGALAAFVGPGPGALPKPAPAQLALITHLHRDHADPDAIRAALLPGGRVLRPAPMEGRRLETAALAEAEAGLADLPQQVVSEWETVTEGPFTITAVPAVDGFGDPQVSYVVEADGFRILHGGDTLFHGSWWIIAIRCGPIDIAFLPVNGAVCDFPHRQPASPLPATMDPLQAATAASLLQARRVVPIHYGLEAPPVYTESPDAPRKLAEAARAAGVEPLLVGPGETVSV